MAGTATQTTPMPGIEKRNRPAGASARPLWSKKKDRKMESFPTLKTKEFVAYVADNSALGIHRKGYNGIASLIPRGRGNNVFVPTFAGLNYETISLAGLTPYQEDGGSKFEPRCEPMNIENVGRERVVLVQPETSHAHVSARITFSVEEPHYLHQRIELVFHRRFCTNDQKNSFRSLWASYIHMPSDCHVYRKLNETTPDLEDWVGVTKEDHNAREFLIRQLPHNRELQAAEHLAVMTREQPLHSEVVPQVWSPMELPTRLSGPLSFYYGFCHGDLLFLMLFKQPERFCFAYSPCGAGKQPAWNPAWDYVLHLDDVQLERTYCWDLCLVVKEYRNRADILDEARRYRDTKEPS